MPAGDVRIVFPASLPMTHAQQDPMPEVVKLRREGFLAGRSAMMPRMVAGLRMRGADELLAEEVVEQLVADCLREDGKNLLARFHGKSAMDAWLMRVAVNRMVSAWRRSSVRRPDPCGPGSAEPGPLDSAMGDLARRALRSAFDSLPHQDRVLLWLHHGFAVPQKRLRASWRRSAPEMSRMLSDARALVRRRTFEAIAREEPGLVLGWDEICEACGDGELYSR